MKKRSPPVFCFNEPEASLIKNLHDATHSLLPKLRVFVDFLHFWSDVCGQQSPRNFLDGENNAISTSEPARGIS